MTKTTKDTILNKLRSVREPFNMPPAEASPRVVPPFDATPAGLQSRFVKEAEELGCYVYVCDAEGAKAQIQELIGDDNRVLSWDASHIPLADLHEALAESGVHIADHNDGEVRVGITGVDVGLAATGSLVLCSGTGKFRTTSLLPDVHIAILTVNQLVADFEAWIESQSNESFVESSNIVVVSGPSKTADIAQELIKGAHGPREVHIVLLA